MTLIQEEQCGFVVVVEWWKMIFTLVELLKGSWDFDPSMYTCFMDLEKTYECVRPRQFVRGAVRIHGARDAFQC